MAQWLELSIEVPSSKTDLATDRLFELGATGLLEDYRPGEAPAPRQPWDTGPRPPAPAIRLLKSWWPPGDRARVDKALHQADFLVADTGPSWTPVSDDDWSEWQRGFNRIVIAEDLAVSPPWDREEGDLIIEPGLAFGTGDHPTTRMCLELLWQAPAGRTCLDVGTGSGILGLAAARRGFEVLGIDVDDKAIESARHNARRNALEARFETTPIQQVEGAYDLVVANLYAELLAEHAADILPRIGDTLVLSGILADKLDQVTEAFADLRVVHRRQEGEWVALQLQR